MSLREDVHHFAAQSKTVRTLVIGDVMLDAYVSGSVLRISPEAPVPVVSVATRTFVPGGAANVAANVRSLGAEVELIGIVGEDEPATRLGSELRHRGIDARSLIADSKRLTTTKTRITAGGQQIVRFDDETSTPMSPQVRQTLLASAIRALERADVCVFSDYAKGIFDAEFCRDIVQEAARLGKPVVVDPKSRDLGRYRGATVITPNLKEASEAAGEPLPDSSSLERTAGILLEQISPSALLVTRGEHGMTLFSPGSDSRHFPALMHEVADVTGAGDTVVAALAIALALGFDLVQAAATANVAAAIAVSHSGTWSVRAEELELAC